MAGRFDSFVIFAEMRTGSNFLEANLNDLRGLACHGEAFNPHFIGYPDRETHLGMTQAERDAAPERLLERIRSGSDLGGFRYFHDHDPRVFDQIAKDPRCAKVILSRDPLESYVSWKIAQSTGQWKLTDVRRRKSLKPQVDLSEFLAFRERIAEFQSTLTRLLQKTGQAPFRLSYSDLQSLDALNGLAAFLGVEDRLEHLTKSLKVQNPGTLASKVSNPQVLEDIQNLRETPDVHLEPDFEPRRVPAVPSYVLGTNTPLVFMPIRNGPYQSVVQWMADVDACPVQNLLVGLSQKSLRQWKRQHKGHRSFTVLRHPVLRAHNTFCQYILGIGPDTYGGIRRTLIKRHALPLPPDGPGDPYDADHHRSAFLSFLQFLRANLNGQTALRVDPSWCTQAQAIKGFSQFAAPDLILREDEVAHSLPALARSIGHQTSVQLRAEPPDQPFALSDFYDEEIEAAAAAAYQRDYMVFGFERWR